MSKKLVTRDTLKAMLETSESKRKAEIIGRALVHLLNRQTCEEQVSSSTRTSNGIGFTAFDAEAGTLDAHTFKNTGTLAQWQINRWMMIRSSGYPRICSYHRQLNEEAEAKALRKQTAI